MEFNEIWIDIDIDIDTKPISKQTKNVDHGLKIPNWPYERKLHLISIDVLSVQFKKYERQISFSGQWL